MVNTVTLTICMYLNPLLVAGYTTVNQVAFLLVFSASECPTVTLQGTGVLSCEVWINYSFVLSELLLICGPHGTNLL